MTSPIYLTAIEPHSGHVFNRLSVPTDQVVTSFSSKSELALHLSRDEHGNHLVFVGYAGAGVGALDVSNSDAVAGQDPTNPVSFAFGSDYAFHRTIVSLDDDGHFSYTPTINYGGNNGRAALLGSNGLYYTVGNANNGNAATFGSASNGTTPDVTETTGVEVVNPINGWSIAVAIPSGNSAEVNPLLQFGLGKKGAEDKPGKDDNFRGITEFNGALYFTKGSGSNGAQTVYTVVNAPQSPAGFVPAPNSGPAAGNVLPTVANAGQQAIVILNGFPTDSARASLADGTSGGDFTPFAMFFANDHTLYVTDEGTGNSADAAHAGLEKWILGSNGTWTLAYTLTGGLIGNVDSNLVGSDRQVPGCHDHRPAQSDGPGQRGRHGDAVGGNFDQQHLRRQRRGSEPCRGNHRRSGRHGPHGPGGGGDFPLDRGSYLRHGLSRCRVRRRRRSGARPRRLRPRLQLRAVRVHANLFESRA